MTTTLTELAATLQTLFTTDATKAAHEAHFIRRQRKLSGPTFVQTLVFAWLDNPQATLDDFVQHLARQGPILTAQAFAERFTPAAADCLRRVLEAGLTCVITATTTVIPLLRRFAGVYLLDSSYLALPPALAEQFPGCGGSGDTSACRAGLKLTLRVELNHGYLEGLNLNPATHADTRTDLHERPLPARSLRLADLGFFDLDALQRYHDQGVYFITRPQPSTVIYDSRGRAVPLARYLARRHGDHVNGNVLVGKQQKLPCRLVAIRAPAAVVARRRQQAHQQSQKHGNTPSADKLELCGWTVFITNVPPWLATWREVWILYRLRWQIELLFKLWKENGELDQSRSAQPYRVLCEVYGKLLALLVQHWLLLVSGGGAFSGQSRVQAAKAVRKQIVALASALGRRGEVVRVLRQLKRMVKAAGKVNRRQGRPSTYQTLMNPKHDGLS